LRLCASRCPRCPACRTPGPGTLACSEDSADAPSHGPSNPRSGRVPHALPHPAAPPAVAKHACRDRYGPRCCRPSRTALGARSPADHTACRGDAQTSDRGHRPPGGGQGTSPGSEAHGCGPDRQDRAGAARHRPRWDKPERRHARPAAGARDRPDTACPEALALWCPSTQRASQRVPRPRCGPPSARTASRAPARDRRRGLAPACVTAGLVPPSRAEAPRHIPAFPGWPGGGHGGSEPERGTRFVCRRERRPSVLPRPPSHLVHGASRAGLFVSTGTGATPLSDRRVLGQRLARGKPPRDRAPRAPHDRGQSPHAARAQRPRRHRRKAPPVFCGQGFIKIPDVRCDRGPPWFRPSTRHRWSPAT
jgi:hypothetical protein